MFQFRRFPTCAYLIQRRLTAYCAAGFPHSVISGSKPVCGSPKLIAACHDLHRLLMPRHSPCALISLTSSAQSPLPTLPPLAKAPSAPLRLLSSLNPLRWASNWFKGQGTDASRPFCRSPNQLLVLLIRIMQASECLKCFTTSQLVVVFTLLPNSFLFRLKFPQFPASTLLLAFPSGIIIHIVQFSRCAFQPLVKVRFQYPRSLGY